MADTKITALTAITTVDPAVDVLPIVDVSDTTMAASGTTKKITSNQILGAGGTATLASATITGDLTVDTSTLKVDSANNRVGIGTATPNDVLEVVGNGATGVRVSRAGLSTQYATLSAGATGPTLDASSALSELTFGIAGSNKMTLNSTGLGVGASPSAKLEVVAPSGDNIVSIFRSGDATAANNAGGGFRSISSATAASRVAQVWLDADGANLSGGDYFLIQKNGSSGTVEFNQFSNAAMTFLTNNTERARIDSSGNVGVGVTPSGTGGCLQLKSGITFPATQVASSDANTLDDYEEGTWTGTLKGSVSDPTTPVTATGRYTKIGRVVTVQIGYENVITTGASGDISISGLPFSNSSAIRTLGSAGSLGGAVFTGTLVAELGNASTSIGFQSINSNASWSAATHSAGTFRYFWAELTYTV